MKTVEAKVKKEIDRSNVHIVHGDLDSYDSLKVGFVRSARAADADGCRQQASEATARITGGGLDYLIANGARLPEESSFLSFGEM